MHSASDERESGESREGFAKPGKSENLPDQLYSCFRDKKQGLTRRNFKTNSSNLFAYLYETERYCYVFTFGVCAYTCNNICRNTGY